MLLGVAPLPPSFPPSATQAFYSINRLMDKTFLSRVYLYLMYNQATVGRSPKFFSAQSCPYHFFYIMTPPIHLTYSLFCSNGAAIMMKAKGRRTTFDYNCNQTIQNKNDGKFLKLQKLFDRKIQMICTYHKIQDHMYTGCLIWL